jgi:hypothetical protein
MPYSVQHDPRSDVATITYTGAITMEDLLGATTECVALQKSAGCLRYLIESPDWMLEASTIEIFTLPTREYPLADLDRRTRIAIVEPPNEKAREAARFFETACRNRGWNARVLPDRGAALGWLLEAVPLA